MLADDARKPSPQGMIHRQETAIKDASAIWHAGMGIVVALAVGREILIDYSNHVT